MHWPWWCSNQPDTQSEGDGRNWCLGRLVPWKDTNIHRHEQTYAHTPKRTHLLSHPNAQTHKHIHYSLHTILTQQAHLAVTEWEAFHILSEVGWASFKRVEHGHWCQDVSETQSQTWGSELDLNETGVIISSLQENLVCLSLREAFIGCDEKHIELPGLEFNIWIELKKIIKPEKCHEPPMNVYVQEELTANWLRT